MGVVKTSYGRSSALYHRWDDSGGYDATLASTPRMGSVILRRDGKGELYHFEFWGTENGVREHYSVVRDGLDPNLSAQSFGFFSGGGIAFGVYENDKLRIEVPLEL